MKNLFLLSTAVLLLAACSSSTKEPRFSDAIKDETAQMQAISKQWDKGDAMIVEGEGLIAKGKKEIKKGQKLVDKGEDRVDDGKSMVKKGKAMKQEAENLYKIQKDLAGETTAQ